MAIVIGSGMGALTNKTNDDFCWGFWEIFSLSPVWTTKPNQTHQMNKQKTKPPLFLRMGPLSCLRMSGRRMWDLQGRCGNHVDKENKAWSCYWGWGAQHPVKPGLEDSTTEASPFRLEMKRPEPWEPSVTFWIKRHLNPSQLWTFQLLSQYISFNICQSGLHFLLLANIKTPK